MIKDDTDQIT